MRPANTVRFSALIKMLMIICLFGFIPLVRAAQFGDMRFELPAGWKAREDSQVLVLTPPDLTKTSAVGVWLLPGLGLGNLNTQFSGLVQLLQSGKTVVRESKVVATQSPEGYAVLQQELILLDSKWANSYMVVVGANPNNRFEALYYSASSQALYKNYNAPVSRLIDTIKFTPPVARHSRQPLAMAQSEAPSQPVYIDAKARANGLANLNPPPPGNARLSGLYVTQDSGGSMGPGGIVYQNIMWRFYYFLPNGYAYLGAKEAGLETIRCSKPTVDKYGDALCTTYSADNGEIRIGFQSPTRLRHKGSDLRIGDYDFALVPKAKNKQLSGDYEYFSAGVAAAISAGFTFSPDGHFRVSNATGIALDTELTGGTGAGTDSIAVAGHHESSAAGTYRINGYTLELNYRDGHSVRAFFAEVAGDDVVKIGSRTYTRKSARH